MIKILFTKPLQCTSYAVYKQTNKQTNKQSNINFKNFLGGVGAEVSGGTDMWLL